MGPQRREFLSSLPPHSQNKAHRPFFPCRECFLGGHAESQTFFPSRLLEYPRLILPRPHRSANAIRQILSFWHRCQRIKPLAAGWSGMTSEWSPFIFHVGFATILSRLVAGGVLAANIATFSLPSPNHAYLGRGSQDPIRREYFLILRSRASRSTTSFPTCSLSEVAPTP